MNSLIWALPNNHMGVLLFQDVGAMCPTQYARGLLRFIFRGNITCQWCIHGSIYPYTSDKFNGTEAIMWFTIYLPTMKGAFLTHWEGMSS